MRWWTVRSALVLSLMLVAPHASAAPHEPLDLVQTLEPLAGDIGFGRCVTAARDLLVVGAAGTGSRKTGAIYIYSEAGGVWSLEERLDLPDAPKRAKLGRSCGTDGERVIAGAPGERVEGGSSGAAYIFRRVGGRWVEEARLVPPEGEGRLFGRAVAIDGDHAVVGATKDRVEDRPAAGAAYAFRFVDGEWRANGKLPIETGFTVERVGFAIGLDGRWLAVGSDSRLGLIRMFKRRAGVWIAAGTIRRELEQEGERFGGSLHLRGRHMLVGYEVEAQGADGVPLFRRRGREWSRELRLVPSDDQLGVAFGRGVAAAGRILAVGGRTFHDRGDSGVVYVFRRRNGGWTESDRLEVARGAFSQFGEEVALSGGTLFVTDPAADGAHPFSGKVYIFR